ATAKHELVPGWWPREGEAPTMGGAGRGGGPGMQQQSMNSFQGGGQQPGGMYNNAGPGMQQQSMNSFDGSGPREGGRSRYSTQSMGSRSAYSSSGSSPQVQDASKGERMTRIWEDYESVGMNRPSSIRDIGDKVYAESKLGSIAGNVQTRLKPIERFVYEEEGDPSLTMPYNSGYEEYERSSFRGSNGDFDTGQTQQQTYGYESGDNYNGYQGRPLRQQLERDDDFYYENPRPTRRPAGGRGSSRGGMSSRRSPMNRGSGGRSRAYSDEYYEDEYEDQGDYYQEEEGYYEDDDYYEDDGYYDDQPRRPMRQSMGSRRPPPRGGRGPPRRQPPRGRGGRGHGPPQRGGRFQRDQRRGRMRGNRGPPPRQRPMPRRRRPEYDDDMYEGGQVYDREPQYDDAVY
ncbi:hypothetical protein THAOC_26398, partial [Thalassiosira oceanica]